MTPADSAGRNGRKALSPLERVLDLFTEVRRGEGATAMALTVNIFLILTAYYMIKPVREALILSVPGGAEIKSYAAAGQTLLLLALVPLYGWLASRVSRMQLIDSVTLVFAACLLAFYAMIMAGLPVAIAFFLWVGIFNLMVPTQFWAFANDVYDPEKGKRLFVLVAFGASAGAVFGSILADEMIQYVGVYEMLLVAAALLVSTLALGHWVNRRETVVTTQQPVEPLEGGDAFRMVFRNHYLLLLAFMLLLNNWVNSNGEYILGHIVKDAADAAVAAGEIVRQDKFIAAFYANYFGAVNFAGLVLQLFVVSRIIKYIGVPVAVCLLPAITMGAYAMVIVLPVLGMVRWVKIAENATDYSLQSTIKQVLYLPTTRSEKYKAKQAIDTFFVRAGDLCSAGLVLAGTQWLAFDVPQFAIVTMVLAGLWLLLSIRLGLRFRRLVKPPDDT